MGKEQPVFIFTATLDELLALRQSLDNLKQAIFYSRNVQMRTIDLLEQWECQSTINLLNEKVSNDSKGTN